MSTIYCLIDYSKALLTPLIAFIAVGIAYQQWITSRNQFRLNYFDKRVAVYTATMEFVAEILTNMTCTQESNRIYLVKTREARFLFEKEIEDYLLEINKKATKLMIYSEIKKNKSQMSGTLDEDIEKIELFQWFLQQQTSVIPSKFEKYLKVEENPLWHLIQNWRKKKRIH